LISGVEAALGVYTKAGLSAPGATLETRSYIKGLNIRSNRVQRVIASHDHDLSGVPVEELVEDNLVTIGFVPSADILAVLSGKSKEFVRVYARIGWEAGRILAALHRSGYLWGTFCDHSLSELHSNAHCDNLIILPRAAKAEKFQLLAPVDYDMSFAKEQAVNVWLDPPDHEDDIVTTQFGAEFSNFLRDLAGQTALSDAMSAINRKREQPKGAFDTLTWIGRDAAVWEFVHAYGAPLVDRSEEIGLDFDTAFDIVEAALQLTIGANA
jgi:hypothetical protein